MPKKTKTFAPSSLPVVPRIAGPKKVWAFAPIGPGAGISTATMDRHLDKQTKLQARYDARTAKAAHDRLLQGFLQAHGGAQRVPNPGFHLAYFPLTDLPDPR